MLVNFAITVDGKISTRKQTPSTFTSGRDKRRLAEIRSLGDAVMAGRGTVAVDAMSMGLSAPDLRDARVAAGKPPAPLRVVVSASGKFDPKWKIFASNETPVLLCTATKIPDRVARKFPTGVQILPFSEEEGGGIPLDSMLEILYQRHGVKILVCEGGPTLLKSLLSDDLVDELYLTIAPVIFGGRGAKSLTGLPEGFLPEERRFRLKSLEERDGEAFLHYVRERKKAAGLKCQQ